jgi:hypothetical protein
MASVPLTFSSNPRSDKRSPPYGGAPMMEQSNPFSSSMMQMFPPGMGNMNGTAGPFHGGPMTSGMPMGGMSMGAMSMSSMSHYDTRGKNQIKQQEFSKGIFIEDFERSVTGEMVYKHFNDIKPVSIIKFPTNKLRLNKGMAFVYFKTAEDAQEVMNII